MYTEKLVDSVSTTQTWDIESGTFTRHLMTIADYLFKDKAATYNNKYCLVASYFILKSLRTSTLKPAWLQIKANGWSPVTAQRSHQ